MATFIDMFAGAGGFSEGFLQVDENGKCFDFLLGSDINPTCEVTHKMRYNEQLGLNTAFLTKDIADPDFVEELLERIQTNFGDSGKITLDLAAHFKEDGKWRDHGMLFKMRPEDIGLLLGDPIEYDLSTMTF